MSDLERSWPEWPDRTDDPGIRRALIPRLVTAVTRRVTRGRSFNFMRVLSIDGRLFVPYLLWNSRLMPRGKLPRWQTEAVILRTAWLCRSHYEWTQHYAIGRANGLSREQIDAVADAPRGDLFDDETQMMLTGVDELLTEHRLSDATYEALAQTLPHKRILEYIMLVGTYSALAGALNTYGAPIEDAWSEQR